MDSFAARLDAAPGGDSARLVLVGELDEMAAGEVIERWDEWIRFGRPIELDLSRITYFSSSGVRALVQGMLRARELHVAMTIGQASRVVVRVLQLTGLADLLRVLDEPSA